MSKVKNIKNYYNLSIEENEIIDRFVQISKLNFHENQYIDEDKIVVHNQNSNNSTNSILYFRNWRKQSNTTNIDQNDGNRINIVNKLGWRNQRDRSNDQKEHTKEDLNWRLQKNKT